MASHPTSHHIRPIHATTEFGGDVINRVTVEWLMSHLTPEEQEILHLWVVEDLTFSEIGVIVGNKYRGRPLTGSTIRYHKNRIKARLAALKHEAGMDE